TTTNDRDRAAGLAERLQFQLAASADVLATFRARFDSQSAAVAFAGAEAAMRAAATASVCRSALMVLTAGLDALAEHARRQAMRGAEFPTFSTSPTTSLMATF